MFVHYLYHLSKTLIIWHRFTVYGQYGLGISAGDLINNNVIYQSWLTSKTSLGCQVFCLYNYNIFQGAVISNHLWHKNCEKGQRNKTYFVCPWISNTSPLVYIHINIQSVIEKQIIIMSSDLKIAGLRYIFVWP